MGLGHVDSILIVAWITGGLSLYANLVLRRSFGADDFLAVTPRFRRTLNWLRAIALAVVTVWSLFSPPWYTAFLFPLGAMGLVAMFFGGRRRVGFWYRAQPGLDLLAILFAAALAFIALAGTPGTPDDDPEFAPSPTAWVASAERSAG